MEVVIQDVLAHVIAAAKEVVVVVVAHHAVVGVMEIVINPVADIAITYVKGLVLYNQKVDVMVHALALVVPCALELVLAFVISL